MKVALLYPEVYDVARFKERRREFPPFGVLYLAAVIEEAGHAVGIKKVTPELTSFDLTDYDAVGFSVSASATYDSMLEARVRSSVRPDALMMVGGVHCSFYPEETLLAFDADVAVVGEAEGTILELLNRAEGKQFNGVPGTLWWDREAIRHEARSRLIADIDQLPVPARHLLPVDDLIMSDRLAGTDTRMTHVMFSRGCPFPCSFCAAAQTKIQYRSGASARKELTHLIDRYGIEGFAVADDNFVVNKRKVSDICAAISDLRLRWSALSRVDTVGTELLGQMAKAGCIEIKYGMESGSERLLRAMKKNTTRAQIERAIRETVRAGIAAKVFIIHGFPGENMETTLETIGLLKELGSDIARVSVFRFVPLPGAEVYEEAEKYGVFGTHHQPDWDGDWSKFHIHHNDRHWWGTTKEWAETQESYRLLISFVEDRWNAQS
jgi:radical SAM superfamily enzyme YgiQ (UPF0313 family)